MVSRDRLLSNGGVFVWLSLIFIPVGWPYFPTLEGELLPVVSRATVSHEFVSDGGISFYLRFDKNRQCDFIGLTWYKGDTRLTLDFEPDADKSYPTRPTGAQYTGLWRLTGIPSLSKTHATVVHSCHPLWNVYTKFYP